MVQKHLGYTNQSVALVAKHVDKFFVRSNQQCVR